MGHESFRVLRIYVGLKGIKCLTMGDFCLLNKLVNYFEDVKTVKLNIRLMLWPGLGRLAFIDCNDYKLRELFLSMNLGQSAP